MNPGTFTDTERAQLRALLAERDRLQEMLIERDRLTAIGRFAFKAAAVIGGIVVGAATFAAALSTFWHNLKGGAS